MKFIKNIIDDELKEHKEAVKTLNKNKIKIDDSSKKKYLLFILLVAFYLWQYFFDTTFYSYATKTLGINPYLYVFIFDLITLILLFIMFYKEIKKGFKNFKENIVSYIEYITLTLLIFLIIETLIGLLCNLIVGTVPENQAAITRITNKLYLLFGSIIYAPIVEETIFRGIIRKFIKNNTLFIIVSGILFGLMHVIGSESIIQYIYLIYYGSSGIYLAYIYSKFNNLSVCITIHFFMNLFATISLLLH